MTTNTISKIINVLYVTVSALFLFDGLTNVEIKSQFIKSFVYLGVLIGTPIILSWNVFYLKSVYKKIFGLALPVLVLILIIIGGPLKTLLSSGTWRTQTILYQNGHLTFYRIESQMQDVGAFGYNRRIVKVLYLTPLFMIISPVVQDIDKHVEWVKVDKEVNELDLK